MANTSLVDTAIVQGAIGGSGVMYIMQVTKDGAALGATDLLGQASGAVHELPIKRTSSWNHTWQNTSILDDRGRVVGMNEAISEECFLDFVVYGASINILKVLMTQGVYWRLGDYEPNDGGYLKRYCHIGKFGITGPVERVAGQVHEYPVRFTVYELESATADTNGIGKKYYQSSVVSSITPIASATDV